VIQVGFEILTAVSTKMAGFWVLAPIALMMEAARTSETLVNFYQTTWRYNPEENHPRCFLFPVANGKQDTLFASVDIFLNTSSVYRELSPKQVLRMWTSENTLNLDILRPIICSNTSNSVDAILKTFLKPAHRNFQVCQIIPYLVPSLRKCLVHQHL
jgi:hypothetical protein